MKKKYDKLISKYSCVDSVKLCWQCKAPSIKVPYSRLQYSPCNTISYSAFTITW